MRIQSSAHTYTVVARLRGRQSRTNLLVKNETGDSFLLLTIEDPDTVRSLAPLFLTFAENEAFSDFIEGFPFEEKFCAVFAHRASRRDLPLSRALSGATPQARVAAVRSLIGGLMEQDMPSPVICDVLRPENLLCSASGQVKFVYDLALSADYDRDCAGKAQVMLAEIVRTVFAEVCAPSLSRFIAALETTAFAGAGEIYAAFAEIAGEVAAAQVTATRKLTMRERLEAAGARLPGLFAPAAAILLLAALLLLFCYLFYCTVISPPAIDNGITEIGTVEIHDDKEP